MSYNTTIKTNRFQNQKDFELPLKQLAIFIKGLFIKTLDPPQEDLAQPRTVIVACTYKGCK